MTEPVPCHIEAPHPPHEWTPLIADPEHDRVLHLFGVTLPCPGVIAIRHEVLDVAPDGTVTFRHRWD